MKYARGQRALGICDGCGGTFRLDALKHEYIKGVRQGWRVCPDCWDPDHPQNRFGETSPADAETLYDPRPDLNPGRVPLVVPDFTVPGPTCSTNVATAGNAIAGCAIAGNG